MKRDVPKEKSSVKGRRLCVKPIRNTRDSKPKRPPKKLSARNALISIRQRSPNWKPSQKQILWQLKFFRSDARRQLKRIAKSRRTAKPG